MVADISSALDPILYNQAMIIAQEGEMNAITTKDDATSSHLKKLEVMLRR